MVAYEGEKEAEGDGHDDVEGDLAGEVTVAIENINEGSEVHGRVLAVEDEVADGVGEGSEEGHEGEIEDEGEINKHKRIDEEGVFAFCGPFFAAKEKIDGG